MERKTEENLSKTKEPLSKTKKPSKNKKPLSKTKQPLTKTKKPLTKTKKPLSKTKKILLKTKQKVDEKLINQPIEFQLDLVALDGYDLPIVDNKDVHGQPKSKKLKQSKPEVLGINYREMEERRLEELLFGELFKKAKHEPQIKKNTNKSSASTKSPKNSKKQTLRKESSETKVTLPEDIYGKNVGLSLNARRQAAWVDEDDEGLK